MALLDSAAPEDANLASLLSGYYCALPRNFDEMVDNNLWDHRSEGLDLQG